MKANTLTHNKTHLFLVFYIEKRRNIDERIKIHTQHIKIDMKTDEVNDDIN